MRSVLHFQSNLSGTYFFLIFGGVSSGCGGHLTTKRGYFASPNYPNRYPTNTDCEWRIQVPAGNSIELTIDHYDIEAAVNCVYDSLKARPLAHAITYAGKSNPKLLIVAKINTWLRGIYRGSDMCPLDGVRFTEALFHPGSVFIAGPVGVFTPITVCVCWISSDLRRS